MGNSESVQVLLKRGIVISPNLFKAKDAKFSNSEKFQFKSAFDVIKNLGATFATTAPPKVSPFQCKPPAVQCKCPVAGDKDKNKFVHSNLWRKITFFLVFPILGGLAASVYQSISAQEHKRPPFIKYEYLRVRHKRFPWGEGNKSLFHNPKVNPLPDGYEEEDDETPDTE